MQPEQPNQPLDNTNPNPAPAPPPEPNPFAVPAPAAPEPVAPAPQPQPAQPAFTPQVFSPQVITPGSAPSPDMNTVPGPNPIQPMSPAMPQPVPGPGQFGAVPAGPATAPWDPIGGKQGKGKKKFIIPALVALGVLLLGSGFVFGYYIPNQPQNVWKTGMSRTAKEMDAFVEKIADPATFETLNKNKTIITGSGDIDGNKFSINFDSAYDETSSDGSANVKADMKNSEDSFDVSAKFKHHMVEGSNWPNMYFNISGLETAGLDATFPQLMKYNGKWISVEQDFFEQFSEQLGDAPEEEETLTHEEAVSIIRDITDVTNEYLFTSDPEKAVLVMGGFVGEEESEGIKANRYKATIHEDNAAAYCKALIDKIYANEAYKKLYPVDEDNLDEEIENQKKSCEPPEENNEMYQQYKEELDIWVDKKHKLLHKVRVTQDLEAKAAYYQNKKSECEDQNARFDFEDSSSFCDFYDDLVTTGESYVEFGQIYNGSDELKMFMNMLEDTNESKLSVRSEMGIKLDGLLLEGRIAFNSEAEDSKGSMEINIKTEPYDGEIDSSKPEGAIPLMDVYEEFFGAYEGSSGQRLGASTDEPGESRDLLAAPGVLRQMFLERL